MSLLSADATELGYLLAAVCFILALKGLSSPRSARRGNLIGAAGAALALAVAFLSGDLDHLVPIVVAIAVGTALAVPAARMVKMTQMPQLVALFNGVGGGAAALVALLELGETAGGTSAWEGDLAAVAFTVLVGAVSFAGSVVTFLKLQEIMTTRPVVLPGAKPLMIGGLVVSLGVAVAVFGSGQPVLASLLGLLGLVVGVMLVLPVGGADVPIVISLLNAFTGLTVAAGGFVLGNTLLLVAGTLVGASGTILTRLMAAAMGRSVAGVMFGALRGGSTAGSTAVSSRPVRSVSPEDVAILLGYARKVIVVPGYGLAVAQAQHTIRELEEMLRGRGIEIRLETTLEEVTATQGRPKTAITCVPLWGEPLSPWEEPRSQVFRDPAKLSSSGLAADMHRILNGDTVKGSGRTRAQLPLHLSFVPAFQPDPARFSNDDFRAVLKFASSVSAYGQIFSMREGSLAEDASDQVQPKTGRQTKQSGGVEEPKLPLVEHLDAILTSVGSKDQPGRFWSGEFFRQGDIDLAKLRRGAFGDLGGAFIINQAANKGDREYVEAVNKRWTGIKEPHFRRCALRARENNLPGVTVLAVGAVRAEIVLQCLKLGTINHLILDTDCADELHKMGR